MKIAGTPPASISLRDEGDSSFERSRATAQAKLDTLIEEAKSQRSSERIVEKLYEIKTGEKIKSIKLHQLHEEWLQIARKQKPAERYAAQCQSRLKQFAAFVRDQNPKIEAIAQITRSVARTFLAAEEKRGIAAKTWNDTLVLLRATFQQLLPAGCVNPFSGIPTRVTETIFRKPFTPEELKAILDAARNDNFIRPILVTGICTAMRRGDCCLLRWKDVDLTHNFITVKTAKTSQRVSVPIFPMLHEELAARAQNDPSFALGFSSESGDLHVFPEQAQMYLDNPDGITWRVRRVFAEAGFKDSYESQAGLEPPSRLEEHKGQKAKSPVIGGEIHLLRKPGEGLGRASIRDFHSFRVTWVTLALTAGVPLELVQKVTGHKTTEVVLKHYFQPGREAFRQAIQTTMPKLLTSNEKSAKEKMREIIQKINPKSVKRDRARLLELLPLV